MDKNILFQISQDGLNYETYVPAGVKGEDVERGLAVLINALVEREKLKDDKFTSFRLMRGIEEWLSQLEELQ